MSDGACDTCLLGSAVLSWMGGHLERSSARSRPRNVLAMTPEDLIRAFGGKAIADLTTRMEQFDATAERDRIASLSILSSCRHRGDFAWPQEFLDDPEPPWVLNVMGDPGLLGPRPARLAVVGARKADSYGRESARRIGRDSGSAGAVVVSGLALGVDAAAHRGALDGGGTTIAVVGGGIDRPYPRANARLHSEIARRGCVVSEMPPGTGVWKWSFPARNRLIAGLSRLVTVVQASVGSGSLHTAEAALARGVPVAAVPGRIDSGLSVGSNRLIADGAIVISDPSVVPELVGLKANGLASVPADLREAFGLAESGALPEALARGGEEASRLALDLARLELEGLVERLPGGRWMPTARRA